MIMFYLTTAMIIFLFWNCPFEENFYTRIEVLNEVTTMFLLYTMLCFTDWVGSPEQRYEIGYFFIAFIILNISVHLFFLAKEVLYQVYLRWVKYLIKQKLNRALVKRLSKKVEKKKSKAKHLEYIVTGYHGKQPKGIRTHAESGKEEYDIDLDMRLTEE